MTEITDTQRMNFIIADGDSEIALVGAPHCKCSGCWCWKYSNEKKEFFSENLRDAIDEAINERKIK